MKNGKYEKFEYRNEGLGTKNERNLSKIPSELELANSELSKDIAAQGMVLLQNKGHALPIEKKGRIALYGGAAYGTVKGGSGSGAVNQREAINIFEGFKRAGYEVMTADWLEEYGKKYDAVNADEMIRKRYGLLEAVPEALLDEAEVKEIAARTETGIYVVGRNSGEGADRKKEKGDYYLSDIEKHNLRCVAKAFKKSILLLNVGGINLQWLSLL